MTNTLRSVTVAAWTTGALLLTSTAWAGQAQQASTGGPQAVQVERYVVGRAKPPEVAGATLRNMSLEDAYAVALENNLDLKVARMNPQGVDYQLQGARAAFDPRLTGTYNYNNATTTSNFSIDGVSRVSSLSQSGNTSFAQALPWYGGDMSISFNNNRSSSNQVTNRFNPSFSTSVNFNYSQPLLAGLRIDATRNQLRTLQVQREIVDLQLESLTENTRASVRQAYWALKQAIEQIEIQRLALELASRQFEDNKIRVEIGTMAPIETTTSETQVVNAEQAVLNAEIAWQTAELNLKRLLASGPDDPIYSTTINPVDLPTFERPTVDAAGAAIAATAALDGRLDLVQARRSIDMSRLNLEVTRDLLRPSLEATTSYRLAGTAGAYNDALGLISGVENPTWTFGFTFNYPLGMKAARASYARAQLQLDQTLVSLKSQELTVASEVYNAGLAVTNTFKQLEGAIKAREVSERNADAEQVRFDVGMSNNYNVALAQNTLTNARLTELSRIIAYLNAVAEFERVQKVGR
ncbi:MAG TPA: TolC family protein [Vicinamibacterales bacterium]|nr:TolC family protein [Vicinamibacterales bacterium]